MVAEQSPLKNVIDVVRRQKRVTVAGNPVAHHIGAFATQQGLLFDQSLKLVFDLTYHNNGRLSYVGRLCINVTTRV